MKALILSNFQLKSDVSIYGFYLLKRPRLRGSIPRSHEDTDHLHIPSPFIVDTTDDPPIIYRQTGTGPGLGIFATKYITPNQPLLSVPISSAITSNSDSWSLSMASTFLDIYFTNHTNYANLQSPSSSTSTSALTSWTSSLPSQHTFRLPWLSWSPEELEELQDEDTLAEAYNLAYYNTYSADDHGDGDDDGDGDNSPTITKEQIEWAVSLVHSRSFIYQGLGHVWLPYIDFCNHSFTNPNAVVNCKHALSQGLRAIEEIAPIDMNMVGQDVADHGSKFELLAGPLGIDKGAEVTISYGDWPNDVLLLFFGWVPELTENPHDSVVLFSNLRELAIYVLLASGSESSNSSRMQEEAETWCKWHPPALYSRMVGTMYGVDQRLLLMAEKLIEKQKQEGALQPRFGSVQEVVRERSRELLASYPTTIEQDKIVLRQQEKGTRLEMAVKYRLGKKSILAALIDEMK